jgi:hypothetical protein
VNPRPNPSPFDELLSDPQLDRLRTLTLTQGLDLLRRRRQRRAALRVAAPALGLILLAAMISSILLRPQPTAQHTAIAQTHPAPTTAVNIVMSSSPGSELSDIHQLSDEELLGLFPGRPVALIGPAGNQRLVFLDQSR